MKRAGDGGYSAAIVGGGRDVDKYTQQWTPGFLLWLIGTDNDPPNLNVLEPLLRDAFDASCKYLFIYSQKGHDFYTRPDAHDPQYPNWSYVDNLLRKLSGL